MSAVVANAQVVEFQAHIEAEFVKQYGSMPDTKSEYVAWSQQYELHVAQPVRQYTAALTTQANDIRSLFRK